MAKEVKDVTNENEILAAEIVAGANAPEVLSPESYDGDFVNVNPWDEESDSNYFREGQETVYSNVNVYVYKNTRKDTQGVEWINMKSIVKKTVRPGSKPFLHEIPFVPGTERGKNKLYMNNLCLEVFGDEKLLPLEIVKRVSIQDNARRVSYSARVSYTNEEGLTIFCPISPAGDGGRAAWANVLAVLKHSGLIT